MRTLKKPDFSILIIIIIFSNSWAFGQSGELRDPYQWPFSKESIWNMPIGSNAVYVDAQITDPGGPAWVVYHDPVIMTPDEPLMDFYKWEDNLWGGERCEPGDLKGQLPVPNDFFLPYTGQTVDHSAGILMQDHRTIKHTHPIHRCPENDFWTTKVHDFYGTSDIYGDGIQGAHGGSALSGVGGTIRLGEFPSGEIHHALKISMKGAMYYYYDPNEATPGYRWPANKADGYASTKYGGTIPGLRMGSLLALPPNFDINQLQTEPARILAKALQDYGAYTVDDSWDWDVVKLPVEISPEGSVDAEFAQTYGYEMEQPDSHPWSQDLITIYTNLHLVDNNGPDNIGGGGTPRAPLAPDFLPSFNLNVETDGTTGALINNPGSYIVTQGRTNTLRVLEEPSGEPFSHWEIISGQATLTNADQPIAQIVLNSGDVSVRAIFGTQEPLSDELTTLNAPTSVTPGSTATVTIDYQASSDRDIVVDFKQPPATSYGSLRSTVEAGTGSINLNIPISPDTPPASNVYQFLVYLAPVGGGWPDRFSSLGQGNVSAAGSFNLTPTDDGSLNPGFTGNNIRIENANNSRVGYLKFNVTGIENLSVTSARLRMYCDGDAGNGTIRVYLGANNNWSESNTGNLPSTSTLLGEINGNFNIGNWYEWGLAANSFTEDGNYTLIVKHESAGSDVWFSSGETANAPELLLETQGQSSARMASSPSKKNEITVEQYLQNDISMYPNPVHKTLSISNLSSAEKIVITDLSGKTILHQDIKNNDSYSVDVSSLKEGVYLLRLSGKQKTKVIRFIKN